MSDVSHKLPHKLPAVNMADSQSPPHCIVSHIFSQSTPIQFSHCYTHSALLAINF